MIGWSTISTTRGRFRGVFASNVDREISAAQFLALYEHMPMVLAVNVVNAALVALVLASYMEQTRWWIFFGLVVTLSGRERSGGYITVINKLWKTKPNGRYLQRRGQGFQDCCGARSALYCSQIILLNKPS